MEKENSKFKKISYSIIGIIIMILFIFLGDKLNIIGNNTNTVPSDNDYVSEYYNIGMNEELLNILYFDVGQGDSTLITINGYTMLIDAGNPSDGYYIADFLKTQGITKIDYLIGTHIDDDHIRWNV